MVQSLNTSQITSITWAVDELKTELNQALCILQDYAESSGKEGSLEDCIQHLKQATGIFAVTHLTLPQLLCEELQSSIHDYSKQTGATATVTISITAEAILELSHYLGNLNRPDWLIPQINNLRALTERELFTESSAFEVNVSSGLKAFNKSTGQPLDSQTIRKLRTLYQRSVLNLIKVGISNETVVGLQKVFKVLYQMGGTAYLSATGYSGLALIERLQSNNLELNTVVKSQFKRLDQVLRKLIAGSNYEDTGLLKNILFYAAIGSNHGELATRLIGIFSLENYSLGNPGSGDGNTASIEPELVTKVVEILQTDIEQAKTWLDDCLYQACEFSEAVTQVDTILKRIDDTLVMVNAGQPRATARLLQEILQSWKALESEKEIDSEELDKFANAMVQLEHRLQNLVNLRGENDSDESADVGSAKLTLLSASRVALTQVKTSITQCIEANGQWAMLREVPSSLATVEGALRFYPLEDLAKVTHCIRRYVRESLLEKREEPDQAEIRLFADVVAAIDYYLECRERGTAFNLDYLISRAMENCVQLGFPYQENAEPSATADEKPESAVESADPEAEMEDHRATGGTEQDDDFEIIEVFVEEAKEILSLATQQLDEWKTQDDRAALLDLRRGFHTLKGGGRVIGAVIIGELSWAIENMLNRIIDNSIETTAEAHDLVNRTLAQYPTLLEELEKTGSGTENDEIRAIQERTCILSDPLATLTMAVPEPEFDVEIAELTSIFVNEAEELRQVIISITGAAESSGNPDQDTSARLIKTLYTLSNSARRVEFDDLADSFAPFQRLLQHYHSVNLSLSTELIALLGIWADQFDKTLTSLRNNGSYDIEPIAAIARSTGNLLQREERARADHQASERKKRFMPLHMLMATGLDKLIIAEQLLFGWALGQLPTDDQDQLLEDLATLKSTAENCRVDEITGLCQLIIDAQTEFSGQESLSGEAEIWFQETYALLLKMLDAVASWQVIPKIPEDLPTSIPQLDVAVEPEAESMEEVSEPIKIEPEVPVSKSDLVFDANFLNPEDEFQQELLDTFLEEADDLVEEIDTSISSWRKDPAAFNNADRIHRALHTLKGGARLSGLAKLGDQSHNFESFMIDQQILQKTDEGFFNRALEWLDQVNEHIEAIREARLTGGSITDIPAPGSIVAPAVEATEETQAEESKEISSLHAISAEALAPTEPPADRESPANELPNLETQAEEIAKTEAEPRTTDQRRDRQEQIRLRADTVEDMVNLSSEATVYRGRVEARISGLDTNLNELEATIDRVRKLTRRLDTETESQIQFRSEQLAKAGDESGFDPLEMDRYSTLQQLSHQLSESVSDLQDLRDTLSESSRDANVLLVQSGRIQTELNGHLMRTRMVPFARVMPRLERIVRQISRVVGKKAELRALDISGELDKQVLESLVPPIEHIVRNSIDHGIEDAEGRKKAGKPQVGRITAHLHRDGAYMVLTLTDDGAGIDFDAVRKRAVERGMVDAARAKTLSQDELAEILFTAGFSTAGSVTQISGRGVGMDVVRSTIREMGGTVSVRSEKGRGSEFSLSIPFTLSVNRALMVRIGDDIYALPLASLEALVRLSRADLASYYENPTKKLAYAADEYEFGYLGEMLKTLERPPIDAIIEPRVPIVLLRVGNYRVALLIDEIIGSHEVVVKSLSQPFNAVPGLSGAAVMGDGSVVVTLDMPTLISSYYESKTNIAFPVAIPETFEEERTPTIMVVDDSVTVRKVTSRFLNREGFIVECARDGVEALRLVHEQQPDLMLVDVEMPRMDGFELLDILKSNERFSEIPVVLITSRIGEKHKQRGLALGADNYFGKPYREDGLLEEINRLLSRDKK